MKVPPYAKFAQRLCQGGEEKKTGSLRASVNSVVFFLLFGCGQQAALCSFVANSLP